MRPLLTICLVLSISCLMMITVSTVDTKVTLSSLEDIEVLTYFLLWKYNYFHNNLHKKDETIFGLNSDTFGANDDEEDVESKLLGFLENLKDNKLIQHITNSSSLSTFDTRSCDNIDNRLIEKWQTNITSEKIRNICEAASGCKSSKQLIELIDSSNKSPVPQQLLSQSIVRLCPLILFQLQEHQCIEQRESHYKTLNRPTSGAIWGFGILFVTIVSFCSLIGVGILPLLTKKTYDLVLNLFEGLAVGSLVGSAIFHLIPQAFNLNTSGSHVYLWKALIIFGGIYLFFWSERIMKMVVEFRRKRKLNIQSIPSCTSAEIDPPKHVSHKQVYFKDIDYDNKANGVAIDSLTENDITSSHENNLDNEMDKTSTADSRSESMILDTINRERSRSNSFNFKHGHSHSTGSGADRQEIATVAWMIIFGDGLHNFIDGIAIGAAFSQSILEGISISVAVICEEFPHELGDFAVLLASGMTMRQALGYNFVSACTCYLGLMFGILLGDLADAAPYVFALASGMFLYIALVDMMGELSTALDNARQQGMTQTFKILLLQNIGILLGVFSLLFLAKYGDKINFEGLVPPKQSDIPFTQ
ncbi:metal cation symporter ZIP14-like [Oppia nitens]|uniref:metal cation symporter ZIP14-like n=1 Tax=Oppia nitens TaxID=1686743 RepID=UPI0023DB06AB|nr:metal cation symporter ZIP14-like [Oppia nitens]